MTSAAAERLADRLAPGTEFVYLHNTYHQAYDGTTMTVKKGRWVKDVDVAGRGGGFRMEIPKQSSHVEWLDERTVRYQIVSRPEHSVTLQFVEE